MKRLLSILSILLFLPINSRADNGIRVVFPNAEILNEHTARIPFKLIDHLIVVQAELYTQKGNFIIDTGSESLILNKPHFKNYKESSKEVSGVNGTIDNPLEKSLEKFILKNFSLKHITSDVIDLSHIERTKKMKLLGIIGFNILKDYEVFIDMHLSQITLTRTDRYGNPLDKHVYLETITDSISFKLKKHAIVLKGAINGQKVTLGLDTAAEYNQINKNAHKDVLKTFIPKQHLKLSDAGNKTITVLSGKLHRLKLSETVYCGPMQTVLTNFKYMSQAFGTHLDGILGYEFLRQKRTIINYKKEKLYFVATPLQRY